MRLVSGEKIIDRLENIEDTKGNGGDRGRLIITNIRVLWHSIINPRISLCMYYISFSATYNQFIFNSNWFQLYHYS